MHLQVACPSLADYRPLVARATHAIAMIKRSTVLEHDAWMELEPMPRPAVPKWRLQVQARQKLNDSERQPLFHAECSLKPSVMCSLWSAEGRQ